MTGTVVLATSRLSQETFEGVGKMVIRPTPELGAESPVQMHGLEPVLLLQILSVKLHSMLSSTVLEL